jgi:hypothetical protein
MKRSIFIILACGLVLAACSDESGSISVTGGDDAYNNIVVKPVNNNPGDEKECDAGETACDGFTLLTCVNGKFKEESCGKYELCAEVKGQHRCITQQELDEINAEIDNPEKECEAEQTKCEAGKVFSCNSSFVWEETADCTASGEDCVEEGGSHICKTTTVEPPPVRECAAGESKCDGNNVYTCDEEGKYVLSQSCTDTEDTPVCEIQAGLAQCIAECTDGSMRCNGDKLETCADGAYTETPCETEGWICKTDNGNAACVEPAPEPECTDGTKRCMDDNIETCVEGFFQVTTSCADTEQVCKESEGTIACAERGCNAGEKRCGAANTLYTCTEDGEWAETKCSASNAGDIIFVCMAEGGSADCVRIDTSTTGTETMDTDGDTIPDTVEGREKNIDTDGDTIPDYKDTDSDNDGIPDKIEARNDGKLNVPPVDSDYDGLPDYIDTDSDNNGIIDKVEVGSNPNVPVDTDSDTIPDYIDYDNDGDGFGDVEEIEGLVSTANPPAAGKFSGACNGGNKGSAASPLDCDKDGKPDYMDTDSDNDTILDEAEGFLIKDGKYARYSQDADGDTVPDNVEAEARLVSGKWTFADADEDGVPDMLEIDSDGDSLSDGYEYALEKDRNCAGLKPRKSNNTDGDAFLDASEDAVAKSSGKFTPAQMICKKEIGVTCKTVSTQCAYEFYFELPEKGTDNAVLTFKPSVSKLDLVFNIDTTGSMSGTITNVKNNISSMITSIRSMVTDSGFGVTAFDDFPINNNGGSNDLPFELLGAISTNNSTVTTNVSKIPGASGGADTPESGAESLYQIVTGAGVSWVGGSSSTHSVPKRTNIGSTWGGVDFRHDTLPVVIHATDAASHDVVDSTYITSSPSAYATSGSQYVVNPHYTKDLIPQLKSHGVRIIPLNVGYSEGDDYNQMTVWARESNAIVPVCAFKTSATTWGCGADKCCLGASASNPVTVTVDGKTRTKQCILKFTGEQSSVANYITQGVDALVKYGTYEVSTKIRGDALSGGKTTACFIDRIEAKEYIPPKNEPEKTCNPIAVKDKVKDLGTGTKPSYYNGFTNFAPGTSRVGVEGANLTFTVYAKNNDCVKQTTTTQVFKAYIDVVNPTTGLLFGTQMVSIVVPPITEGSNE